MADQEWAKRIRAAAAYSGLGLAELASRLDMSDSTLRRHLAAPKRPHEVRALAQTVAEITELPDEFFTVDFARLPELVLQDEAARSAAASAYGELSAVIHGQKTGDGATATLARAVLELQAQVAALAGTEDDALVDLTRRTKTALVDEEEGDAQETPAAADTQSAEASPPATARARAGGRQRSEGPTDA